MLRKTCLVFSLISIVPLTIGCSKTESHASNDVQKPPYKFAVPSEYSHAKDMLDSLTKQGIKIKEIKNSNTMALFQTKPNYAMYIKSELGNFELIHLENKNGKDFTIVKEEENNGRFIYSISKIGEPEQIYDSNTEIYILIKMKSTLRSLIQKI